MSHATAQRSVVYDKNKGLAITSADGDSFLAVFDALAGDETRCRQALREAIGTEGYTYISDEADGVLPHLLAAAIRASNNDMSRGTIVLIGNATENLLSKLAKDHVAPVDLTNTNGIIERANVLKSNSVLTKKHLGMFQFIGNLRNAGDHGIDTDINLEWIVSPEAVEAGLRILMLAIRSCVSFRSRQAVF